MNAKYLVYIPILNVLSAILLTLTLILNIPIVTIVMIAVLGCYEVITYILVQDHHSYFDIEHKIDTVILSMYIIVMFVVVLILRKGNNEWIELTLPCIIIPIVIRIISSIVKYIYLKGIKV